MNNIGVISYAIAAGVFLVLSLLLITSWRGRLQGAMLVSAAVMTSIWAALAALQATVHPESPALQVFESLRNALWYLFLLKLLGPDDAGGWLGRRLRKFFLLACGLILLQLGVVIISTIDRQMNSLVVLLNLPVLGFMLQAILGLILVEQLFRNTRPDQRWAIKFLCLGVGGMFAYDFYLYADALLFRQISIPVWDSRGMAVALVAPLVAVSAARNPRWSLDVFVSRSFIFHTTALLGTGIYLLIMAAGGYYIRLYGGDWGFVVQMLFFFGAAVLLLAIMFSGQARARLKIFLNKHFYNYKYDYREEWLNFINKLSSEEPLSHWREQAIHAIADIVDSPGGILWMKQEAGHYEPVAHSALADEGAVKLDADQPLIRFLKEKAWVINLQEYQSTPEIYPGLVLPSEFCRLAQAWLIIPLLMHTKLLGFIVLACPRAPRSINWEDNDLLRTAGRQVAAYLAQLEASQALINVRQFEAANRLSAYVMHDIKNLIAQLSLMVSNAARHKDNPVFIEDMIGTVENSVNKMNRLLNKLRAGEESRSDTAALDLVALLYEVVKTMSAGSPAPVLCDDLSQATVQADWDRLCAVVGHVIRNAQDATRPDGHIRISLQCSGADAQIAVEDSGRGMDSTFISERLFRPFDSTKGSAGMGIGAYECREYVRELGGEVQVKSQSGKGTVFQIRLPLLVRGGPQSKVGA